MHNRRLIEETFPLKEVSEHSKHEKNVRHGHISTLHIWPARRPLAACRAAIIAALMPDPDNEEERQKLNKKIASITKWKTEDGPALDYFREEIRKAYNGRAPRVLDMFAGGGAIPLEAMRLGCEVTAIDYNPVAWFILKCTLEFPQRLAGKTWPLPQTERVTGTGVVGEEPPSYQIGENVRQLKLLKEDGPEYQMEGNLADHVRYWGNWVLAQARAELAPYYPTIEGQPTVAYLWARTVPCPDPRCGTIVPLLKTLWLSKKAEKTLPDTPENRARPDFLRLKTTKNTSQVIINGRRALRLIPPKKGEGGPVQFEIWTPKTEDKVPEGTMSGATSRCPTCGINVTADYIKECGHAGKLGVQMIAAVMEADFGKDYRISGLVDERCLDLVSQVLSSAENQIMHGFPNESLPGKERHRAVGSQLPDYGFKVWSDIYTDRQLLTIAKFIHITYLVQKELASWGYPLDWIEAISSYLAVMLSKLINYSSTLCIWANVAEEVKQTFTRFALPMTWDFAESCPTSITNRYYLGAIDTTYRVIEKLLEAQVKNDCSPSIIRASAISMETNLLPKVDAIITDPPYYDAIPYSDLSDFFHVWLRRILPDYTNGFDEDLSPKNEELVQQHRTGESGRSGKERYEKGMAVAFNKANELLTDEGYMVIVFANKQPDAWETLVSALIYAGFIVTASWPIDTEMQSGVRSKVASLASSIWLVCRKRPGNAGVGRYRAVRKAMEERVTERLRYFWDIGLSGPDFVWAAIGPALESYSAYSEVRRLDGSPFTVSEFLKDVRRLVADFALGQILKGHSTEGLDEWTRYYLMHRSSFGLEAAPVGECILLAQGYGLELNELKSQRGFIVSAKRSNNDDEAAGQKTSGSQVQLAKWDERTRDDLGEPHPSGGLPMIDMLHRLIHLWFAGDLNTLNVYVGEKGLRQNELFWAMAQAVLEMASSQSRERTLLEAIVAWGRGVSISTKTKESVIRQPVLITDSNEERDS